MSVAVNPRAQFRLRTSGWTSTTPAGSGAAVWLVGELDPALRKELTWSAGGTADVTVVAANGAEIVSTSVAIPATEWAFALRVPSDGAIAPGEYAVRVRVRPSADAALPVSDIARLIVPETQVVAIDEAQFLDARVVELVTTLANRGLRVIVAGTDTDFRGEPFGAMPQLLAVAEVVDKLNAICVKCGNPASRNQRLIGGRPARYDSPTIMVGSAETYEARCRACHSVPRRDEDQVALL